MDTQKKQPFSDYNTPSLGVVLIIDTDPGVRWAVSKALERSHYIVKVAGEPIEALRIVHEEQVDIVVMEVLPEAGLTTEILTNILQSPAAPQVICVSIDSDPQNVIECIRRGASDFLPKPFSLDELRTAILRVTRMGNSSRSVKSQTLPDEISGSLLIGISMPIQELRNLIYQVAKTNLNCLIRGESGSGKDLVAREIHRLSPRKDKPFVKVNCSALPEQLLESELFGYEKGAFTGATSSKPGRFELANHGIIFLDEVADIHPNLQAKLLQVIEHKEFTKLGGRSQIKVDVQILAATNANLEQKTEEGSFRQDLYFRLNEVSIWVPSLSSRKEDIPLLVRHFLQKHSGFGEHVQLEITAEDLEALASYSWPGNVRELESTIKRWLAFGEKIMPWKDINQSTQEQRSLISFAAFDSNSDVSAEKIDVLNDTIKENVNNSLSTKVFSVTHGTLHEGDDENETKLILETLERCKWNRKKAAEMLGMSYQNLRRKLKKILKDTT